MLKNLKNFSNIDELPIKNFKLNNKINYEFFNEQIKINKIDYYYSNAISRSSKTMSDCRNARQSSVKTGTNN